MGGEDAWALKDPQSPNFFGGKEGTIITFFFVCCVFFFVFF